MVVSPYSFISPKKAPIDPSHSHQLFCFFSLMLKRTLSNNLPVIPGNLCCIACLPVQSDRCRPGLVLSSSPGVCLFHSDKFMNPSRKYLSSSASITLPWIVLLIPTLYPSPCEIMIFTYPRRFWLYLTLLFLQTALLRYNWHGEHMLNAHHLIGFGICNRWTHLLQPLFVRPCVSLPREAHPALSSSPMMETLRSVHRPPSCQSSPQIVGFIVPWVPHYCSVFITEQSDRLGSHAEANLTCSSY
jgi:hypothetical protein